MSSDILSDIVEHLIQHRSQLDRIEFGQEALKKTYETTYERIFKHMSAQTDALSAQFDNIQTSLTNLATHQNKAFTDLKAAIDAGEDTATLQALTARAQSFTTDIANQDAAATAADPGAAVVTQPGTPDPVTPAAPPASSENPSSDAASGAGSAAPSEQNAAPPEQQAA